jgi:protease I
VLYVLSSNGFYYPDYGPSRQELEDKGVVVKVASSTRDLAMPVPETDPPVRPDLILKDARAADFDAVIFPGNGIDRTNEFEGDTPNARDARKFMQEMLAAGKLVTGLCGGAAVLADAGVLAGKEATGYPTTHAQIRQGGGILRATEMVVVSGQVMTGRDFDVARPFAQELYRQLELRRRSHPPR